MKISYRTHPALSFLDNGIEKMKLFEADAEHFEQRCKSYEVVSECYETSKELFRKSINVITEPFHSAIVLSVKKMMSPEILESMTEDMSGTFIYGKYTTCYKFDQNEMVVFSFWEDKMTFLMRGGNDTEKHITFFSEANYKTDYGKFYDYERVPFIILSHLVATINFIKYAPVETKYLPAGRKVKDVECNYKNDTRTNITILNSTWTTNLVKSDAFNVRAHLRWQPKKKDGKWTKELIWIDEFEKTGYTAPARKLKEPDCS